MTVGEFEAESVFCNTDLTRTNLLETGVYRLRLYINVNFIDTNFLRTLSKDEEIKVDHFISI